MTRVRDSRRGKWGAIGISLLLIVTLLVLSLPEGVAAIGSPPHRFWGTVYMNNMVVDDGTEVSVWSVGGTQYASTTTFTINSTQGRYLIDVPGTSEGETLIFRVTGINAKTYNKNGVEIVTVYFHVGGSGDDTWHSNVDLKAETPPHILRFFSASQSIDAGQPSAAMTIQHYNENDILSPVSENTAIRLTSSSAQGSFSTAASPWGNVTTVTMVAGDNSVSFYYKDTKAGTPTVTASRVGWQSATQTEIINPLSASQLAVTGISDPVAASAASSVTVTAKDGYGNTATSYRGTVHFTSSDGNATLPGDYTFQARDNGVRIFVGAVILTRTGEQWVMATDTGTPSISGVQTAITVTAAPACRLQITGSTIMTAGGSNELTITARDQYGNVVTAYAGSKQLYFSGPGTAPGGQIPKVGGINVGSATTVIFINGVSRAGAANLVTCKAETTIVNVTDGTYTSSGGWGLTLTVTPAALDHLVVTGSASMDSGSNNELTVTTKDGYGNVVTSYSGTKTLIFSGPGTLGDLHPTVGGAVVGSATPVNFTSGVSDAGAATLVAYKVETTTVDVSDGSKNSFSDPAYDLDLVVNVAGAHLVVTSVGGTATAGSGKELTITAKDINGIVITSYNGDKSLIFSGPGVAPDGQQPKVETTTLGIAVSVRFTSGVSNTGAATLTAYKAETTTVDVTDGNINSFGSPAYDLDLTVNAATTVSRLEVTGLDTMIAGDTNELTIVAKDQYGNVATSYSGAKSLTFSGPGTAPGGQTPTVEGTAIGSPRSVTFTSGVSATNAATLNATKAETTTVDVTDGTNNSFGSPNYDLDLMVTSASVSQLGLTGISDPVVAGVASSVTVTAKDAYGNVATGYTGTVHFTSSDTQAALPSNYAFLSGDNGVKIFSNGVIMKTVGDQWVKATDTVTSSIYGQQSAITVTAATVAYLVVTGNATMTAGGSNELTITARDQYGNVATGYSGSKSLTFSGPGVAPDGQQPKVEGIVIGTSQSVTFASGISAANKATLIAYKVETTTVDVTDGTYNSFGEAAYDLDLTVNAATASRLEVTGSATMTAGENNELTITAKDAYGNVATGYSGAKSLTFSGPAISPGGQAPTVKGVAVGSVTSVNFTSGVSVSGSATLVAYKVETTTVDVNDGSINSSANAAYDLDLTVTSASVSQLGLTGISDPVVAGVASSVTVTARDAYGNVATGYTGTIHFTSSDAQAVLPGNYTFISGDNGVKAFSSSAVIMKTAGEQWVRATDTVTSSINGQQTGITVTPAAISRLVFITSARIIATGEASAVMTVQTQDAYGNPVNVSPVTTLNLNSTSTPGRFSLNPTSWGNITSVNIATGQNSASFYYKDTLVGTPTITVSRSGWASATQQETVSLVTIAGEVNLQGRPAKGNDRWITNLTVTFLQGGVVVRTESVITDNQGRFNITGIPTGTYDIRVKSAHTLSNLVSGQVIVPGNNPVNFGTLREGDANNDNIVNINDVTRLITSFGKASGQPGFIINCDFNQDGLVNINDVTLMAVNFGTAGIV